MKKLFLVPSLLLVIALAFTGCGGGKDYKSTIYVTDCKTDEIVLQLEPEDDEEKARLLLDAATISSSDAVTISKDEPDYSMRLVDQSGANQPDSYCNFYIVGEDLYVQWDAEKMKDSNPEVDSTINKCRNLTAEEFLDAVNE